MIVPNIVVACVATLLTRDGPKKYLLGPLALDAAMMAYSHAFLLQARAKRYPGIVVFRLSYDDAQFMPNVENGQYRVFRNAQ